jgi:transcriptional regulator with XRE-family HTH domain
MSFIRTSAIKAEMYKNKMTQAELCRLTGLSRSYISAVLADKCCPSDERTRRIATALRIHPYKLLSKYYKEDSNV